MQLSNIINKLKDIKSKHEMEYSFAMAFIASVIAYIDFIIYFTDIDICDFVSSVACDTVGIATCLLTAMCWIVFKQFYEMRIHRW